MSWNLGLQASERIIFQEIEKIIDFSSDGVMLDA
jgi:hypothetical protein